MSQLCFSTNAPLDYLEVVGRRMADEEFATEDRWAALIGGWSIWAIDARVRQRLVSHLRDVGYDVAVEVEA